MFFKIDILIDKASRTNVHVNVFRCCKYDSHPAVLLERARGEHSLEDSSAVNCKRPKTIGVMTTVPPTPPLLLALAYRGEKESCSARGTK